MLNPLAYNGPSRIGLLQLTRAKGGTGQADPLAKLNIFF